MKTIYRCICGEDITRNKEFVSNGYFGACLNCNVDMYKFETIEIKREENL